MYVSKYKFINIMRPIHYFFGVMFLLLALSTKTHAQPGFGQSTLFTKDWKFILDDVKDGASTTLDDSRWRTLSLPHDWSVEYPNSPDKASATGYLPGGIGWYRKSFEVPSADKEKRLYIYFEGVYNHSEVYINGQKLGYRPNGYVSFMYDLTPYIRFGAENLLAVRVNHSEDADSRWYTGSGIYRNVYLTVAPQVHIDLWGVFYQAQKIDSKQATVQVQTTLKNASTQASKLQVIHEVKDATGKIIATQKGAVSVPAGESAVSSEVVHIKSPKLWSVETPNLYTLHTRILSNGKQIDESTETLGLRTVHFDANKGFFLNGKSMKLKGVCIHHDAGILGAAVPREVWYDRLSKLKSLGVNAIRLSHNPQATMVYEICDQIGLMMMDEAFDEWEFPKKKWIEGWNQGKPGFQGSASYFAEWSEKDVESMVRRDRNHPSIVLWSIGNEVDYPNDPYSHPVLNKEGIGQQHERGYRPELPNANRMGDIAKKLIAAVKRYDTSRPVTGALAGPVMSNETEYPGALDVVGYNYTENRYAQDHQKYPNRVLYGSENRHDMEAWKAVRDNEYISGMFLWTGLDYLGEAGRFPSRGFTTGLVDLAGRIKPNGHFRSALWSETPVTYIGTSLASPGRGDRGGQQATNTNRPVRLSQYAEPNWYYRDGQQVRVVCYTNCAESELWLNGKIVGERQKRNDEVGIIYWDIPYEAGALTVKSYNDNKLAAEYTIRSYDRPETLTASCCKKEICAESGMAQIVVEIKDKDGNPVWMADDEISCRVEGPARLVAMESSQPNDMTNNRTPRKRAYHGYLVAYVQPTGEKGTVTVSFSAPWLKSDSITLEMK